MRLNLKNLLIKKLKYQRENNQFLLTSILHLIKYFFNKSYRKNRCLIDPSPSFFFKYRNLANYLSFPLSIYAKYLKKNKILISVNNNCNFSVGHIYGEIDQLKRMQSLIKSYSSSEIWFLTSRKEILNDTALIFENRNFKILFGGLKKIFLTFVAIKCPNISIDASLGNSNYILGSRPHSHRIVHNTKEKRRAQLTFKSPEFYPIREKLNYYSKESDRLIKKLNLTEKYVVIQIKTVRDNATVELLNPKSYLDGIKFFQKKGFQIVFAGREICPEFFIDNNVIDYANSKYASPLNDYLLVGNCSFVISSASGFLLLAESLDKPVLAVNSAHIMGPFGRRSIILPTLLGRRKEIFNATQQHKYLCFYGPDCGYKTLNDMSIYHMPNSEEILEGVKELEKMSSNIIPSFTFLQKKIRENGGCPKSSKGLSRISDYFIKNHENFFYK